VYGVLVIGGSVVVGCEYCEMSSKCAWSLKNCGSNIVICEYKRSVDMCMGMNKR
jgi:hypothetical protein